MSKVYTHMTMSLDGFIADPQDGIDELFGWYGAGDVTVPTANEMPPFSVDESSAELLRELIEGVGAMVCRPTHRSTSPTGGTTTTRWAHRWSS